MSNSESPNWLPIGSHPRSAPRVHGYPVTLALEAKIITSQMLYNDARSRGINRYKPVVLYTVPNSTSGSTRSCLGAPQADTHHRHRTHTSAAHHRRARHPVRASSGRTPRARSCRRRGSPGRRSGCLFGVVAVRVVVVANGCWRGRIGSWVLRMLRRRLELRVRGRRSAETDRTSFAGAGCMRPAEAAHTRSVGYHTAVIKAEPGSSHRHSAERCTLAGHIARYCIPYLRGSYYRFKKDKARSLTLLSTIRIITPLCLPRTSIFSLLHMTTLPIRRNIRHCSLR